MRRLLQLLALASLAFAGSAGARDADMILRGSLLDAVVEFREEQRGEDPTPKAQAERSPATTNPTRPDRKTPADDNPSAAGAESTSDDDGDDDGASFEFALRGGYDSNYDEFRGGPRSGFTEVSTSGSVTREVGEATLFAQANATYLRLPGLAYADRPDAATELAIRRKLSDEVALTGAFGTEIDASDDPVVVSSAVAVGVEVARAGYALALRGSYDNEVAVYERFDDDGGLGVFDFQRPAVEATALLSPDARVSPYASAGLSRITFFERLPAGVENDDGGITPSPKRDAVQATGAVGLRAKLTDTLVVKAGGRLTRRDFDARGLKTRLAFSPELEVTWTLPKDVTIEGSFQRTLVESDEFGSLAQDTDAVSLSVDYAPDTGFGLNLTGEYERTREIGIDLTTDDLSLELVAKYRMANKVFFELGLLRSWSIERSGPDDSSRTRVSAGGGYSF